MDPSRQRMLLAALSAFTLVICAEGPALAERGRKIVLLPMDCPIQLPRPNVLYAFALSGKVAPITPTEPCTEAGGNDESCGNYLESIAPWKELVQLEERASALHREGRAQLERLPGEREADELGIPPHVGGLVIPLGASPRTPEAVAETIVQAAGGFRKCGTRADTPAVLFSLDSQGRVVEANTVPGTGNEKNGACVADLLRRLEFEPVQQRETAHYLLGRAPPSSPALSSLDDLHAPLDGEPLLVKTSRRGARSEFEVDGTLSTHMVRRVIGRNIARFQNCYAEQLRRDPELSGTVRVTFTIGPAGRVTAARSVGSHLPAAVRGCIETRFRSLRFPPPEGGSVTYTSPIIFRPGGGFTR